MSIPASYSGGSVFNTQRGARLHLLRFGVAFFSPSRQLAVDYFKFDHERFLPHPFKFIVHQSFHHSNSYIIFKGNKSIVT
jgi:hypothetical protein